MSRAFAVVVLLAVVASPAIAQVRYSFGDDVRWAAPDFDDSQWPLISSDGFLSLTASTQYVWFRFRVGTFTGSADAPAVLWPSDCGSLFGPAELFINGRRVAAHGSMPPRADLQVVPSSCVFRMEEEARLTGTPVQVAVRVWAGWVTGRHNTRVATARLGRHDLLNEAEQRSKAENRLSGALEIGLGVLTIILGVLMLAFWRLSRAGRLIALTSVWLITSGLHAAFVRATLTDWVGCSATSFGVVESIIFTALILALLEVQWSAYGLRRAKFFHAARLIVFLPGVPACVAIILGDTQPIWRIILLVCVAFAAATLLALAVYGSRRKGESRLLGLGLLTFTVVLWMIQIGSLPQMITVGAFQTTFGTIANVTLQLIVAGVLLRRAWHNWKRNQRTEGEIAAAHQMQSAFMPAQQAGLPGFVVEIEYLPADVVGGDFYFILPCGVQSSLVVAGDVSGKGLRAAMVVSMIAGAVNGIAMHESAPAAVLEQLNVVLMDRLDGGFVTCCCIRLHSDGSFEYANAGHIAPYSSGAPLPSEPGLPLGVAADATWVESTGTVPNGETLIIVSDGLVEARSPTGELYGFDRVEAQVARFRSATAMVEAAREFEQQDDITVVAITRQEARAYAA